MFQDKSELVVYVMLHYVPKFLPSLLVVVVCYWGALSKLCEASLPHIHHHNVSSPLYHHHNVSESSYQYTTFLLSDNSSSVQQMVPASPQPIIEGLAMREPIIEGLASLQPIIEGLGMREESCHYVYRNYYTESGGRVLGAFPSFAFRYYIGIFLGIRRFFRRQIFRR